MKTRGKQAFEAEEVAYSKGPKVKRVVGHEVRIGQETRAGPHGAWQSSRLLFIHLGGH